MSMPGRQELDRRFKPIKVQDALFKEQVEVFIMGHNAAQTVVGMIKSHLNVPFIDNLNETYLQNIPKDGC